MGIRAKSSNTGISVKKLKPIVNLVRGMKVEEALTTLRFMPSPAAAKVAKTVKSAASNAENELMARTEDLKIFIRDLNNEDYEKIDKMTEQDNLDDFKKFFDMPSKKIH